MSVAKLRASFAGALRDLAWTQWSQMGVSVAAPAHRTVVAADPEALLLFSLEVGRDEPRLLDEALDWFLRNESVVSVHRLRALARVPEDRALADAARDWVAANRRAGTPPSAALQRDPGPSIDLFRGGLQVAGPVDTAFSRHGLLRPPLLPSGKSQAPDLRAPVNFALRLRRLLGIGVRAEVVRALLTIQAPRLHGQVVVASAGFSARNVREGLVALAEAGVVDVFAIGDDRQYAVRRDHWASLLGLEEGGFPLHRDWIPAMRATVSILRWLVAADASDLSPYMLASGARTVLEGAQPDLRFAGLNVSPRPLPGADYWPEFATAVTEIAAQLSSWTPSGGREGVGAARS